MINRVLKYINENNMIEKGEGIVLGVSGGADSICLLVVLGELRKQLGIDLYVVHINHGIRGEEARRDEQYVETFCKNMGIWCKTYQYHIPEMSKKHGMSEEEMGRTVRYQTFEMVRKEVGAEKIAVAHNSNDSVETVLYNMCRGTGIKGVCGIPPRRDKIIRPLLCCSRNQIETFLKERNIMYKTDSTNLTGNYTRNKIRLELIPYLTENVNPKSMEHILSLAQQLSSVESYIKDEAEKAYQETVEELQEENKLNIELLASYPDIIKQEVIRISIRRIAGQLKDITAKHIGDVQGLLDNTTGKSVHLPYHIICENRYGYCMMKKKEKTTIQANIPSIAVPLADLPGEYVLESGEKFIFTLENSAKFKEKMYTKWFDYDKIKNAMQIRFRKNGDFLEVANGGHKKLKSYLIDEKVPREQRNHIPLLADGSHIIWIVGYRISEAYKITDSTKNVLKVQFIERNGNSDGR